MGLHQQCWVNKVYWGNGEGLETVLCMKSFLSGNMFFANHT